MLYGLIKEGWRRWGTDMTKTMYSQDIGSRGLGDESKKIFQINFDYEFLLITIIRTHHSKLDSMLHWPIFDAIFVVVLSHYIFPGFIWTTASFFAWSINACIFACKNITTEWFTTCYFLKILKLSYFKEIRWITIILSLI